LPAIRILTLTGKVLKFLKNSKKCLHNNKFYGQQSFKSTHPVRPIMTDNVSYSCVAAAAGTCIGHSFFSYFYHVSCMRFGFTTIVSSSPPFSWLGHTFVYCLIFLTAASVGYLHLPCGWCLSQSNYRFLTRYI